MKKVLLVSHNVAMYREALFTSLLNSSEVDYFLAACPDQLGDIKGAGSSIVNHQKFIPLKNYWLRGKVLVWQSGLFKKIVSGNFDVVVMVGDPHFLTCWLYGLLLKATQTKLLFWTHGFIRNQGWKDYVKEKAFYALPDGLILYGDQAKKNLVDLGRPENTLFPVYNSLDYQKQKQVRDSITQEQLDAFKSKLFANDYPIIMFVGRLTRQKKLHLLIEVLGSLLTRGINCNLMFVGDGAMREELENMSVKHGVDRNTLFWGKTYAEEELAQLIMSSSVCVSPGEVGLTAMHVLAYGLPVITHDSYINQMPEYEAIEHGVSGLLYKYQDYNDLENKIADLLLQGKAAYTQNCISIIESKYNPASQTQILNSAVNLI